MTQAMVKEEAHRLVDRLPDSATWDDLIREIYVRQVIEHGLADSNAGLFGLEPRARRVRLSGSGSVVS